jgi:nitrate reductase NapE component
MKPKQSQPRRDKLTESPLLFGVRPIFLVAFVVAILFLLWFSYRMLTA